MALNNGKKPRETNEHLVPSSQSDPVLQAFLKARAQLKCGPNVSQAQREEAMFRAGVSFGRSWRLIEMALATDPDLVRGR